MIIFFVGSEPNGSIVIGVNIISSLGRKFTKCKYCDNSDCVKIRGNVNNRKGVATKLIISCSKCNASDSIMTSNIVKNIYYVKLRFAYGL